MSTVERDATPTAEGPPDKAGADEAARRLTEAIEAGRWRSRPFFSNKRDAYCHQCRAHCPPGTATITVIDEASGKVRIRCGQCYARNLFEGAGRGPQRWLPGLGPIVSKAPTADLEISVDSHAADGSPVFLVRGLTAEGREFVFREGGIYPAEFLYWAKPLERLHAKLADLGLVAVQEGGADQ